MTAKRAHLSLKTKLAAALLALGDIPYLDAKAMTTDQIISLYNFDHGILHAIEPIDEFWNLTPRLRAEHRQKSRRDVAVVAKVRRLEAKHRPGPPLVDGLMSIMTMADREKARKHLWPKRKIASRPFAKRRTP